MMSVVDTQQACWSEYPRREKGINLVLRCFLFDSGTCKCLYCIWDFRNPKNFLKKEKKQKHCFLIYSSHSHSQQRVAAQMSSNNNENTGRERCRPQKVTYTMGLYKACINIHVSVTYVDHPAAGMKSWIPACCSLPCSGPCDLSLLSLKVKQTQTS